MVEDEVHECRRTSLPADGGHSVTSAGGTIAGLPGLWRMTEPLDAAGDGMTVEFLGRLGGAMMTANYPADLVRRTLTLSAEHCGLTNYVLVLPNYIQVGGPNRTEGTRVRVVHGGGDLRYDQTFPLAALVDRAESGRITPVDGLAELDRIYALRPRFPGWVGVLGYAVQSAGFALILQPTPVALLAAVGFGLLVGVLSLIGRFTEAIGHLLPAISAFLVALTAFTVNRFWYLGEASLRLLIPPLAVFMPGVAITLAVIELTTGEEESGSIRLMAGFMRLAQLAFGILIAAQLAGLTASQLSTASVNKLGTWAPWLGVAVYALGILFYLGPPTWFLPWVWVTMFVSYGSQVIAGAVFGSYASGFGGGLALTLCALVLSQRPNAPPATVLILPGFWMLVPGSIGLIGVTELINAASSTMFSVTLISLLSIALGVQAGLLSWRVLRKLYSVVRNPRPQSGD